MILRLGLRTGCGCQLCWRWFFWCFTMDNNYIFELKDAHFSYLGRYPALRGIDITVRQGEQIAVIGANGCGKSTLLHILDGLIFADRGSFKAFGKELKEGAFNRADFSRDFRKKVGLVFQNPDVQLFCPTVKEDIVFGPLQLGVEKGEIQRRLEGLVSILNIGDLLERPPQQLSIGEKRKVAIASTHDLHILEEISDTVYVFSPEKRIVRSGCPHEVLADEQLLKDNNLLHIHSHRHRDKTHIHSHVHLEHHG